MSVESPKLEVDQYVNFWKEFIEQHKNIEFLLNQNNDDKSLEAYSIIKLILKKNGLDFDILIGRYKRFGYTMPRYETNKMYELVFTNISKFDEIEKLIDHVPKNTPEKWFFAKHQFPLPEASRDFEIPIIKTKLKLTNNDVMYSLVVNVKESKDKNIPRFHLFLAIDDKLSSHFIEKKDTSDVLKFKSGKNILLDHLLSCLGDYYAKKSIIDVTPTLYSSIEKDKDKFKSLTELTEDMNGFFKSGIIECVACRINNHHAKLMKCSRCKKVNYCCKSCQLFDYPTHKLMCAPISIIH